MLTKINKVKARKLYAEGSEIILCGDRVNTYHILDGWHLGCSIAKSQENPYLEKTDRDSFDDRVSNFQWYLDPQLGRRAAYYIKNA